jgi:ArsR family transcriptional regulator
VPPAVVSSFLDGLGGRAVRDWRPGRGPHPPDALVELIASASGRRGAAAVRLLDRLRDGEATCASHRSDRRRSRTSKTSGAHDAGIVRARKVSSQVFYRVVDEGVFQLCESVCGSVERQVR